MPDTINNLLYIRKRVDDIFDMMAKHETRLQLLESDRKKSLARTNLLMGGIISLASTGFVSIFGLFVSWAKGWLIIRP